MTVSFCLNFDPFTYIITTDEYRLGISRHVICFSPIRGQCLGQKQTDKLSCDRMSGPRPLRRENYNFP